MPQTSKAERPFTERLKSWFKTNKSNYPHPQDVEYNLSPDTLRDLEVDQPVHTRLEVLRELKDIVTEKRLQQHGVELLWFKVNDLCSAVDPEVRQAVLDFFCSLVSGQYSSLDIMRAQFFRFIKEHNFSEDLTHRIKLFSMLTDEGKDILHFEEQAGALMLELLKETTTIGNKSITRSMLLLATNLVKYNSAYLDMEIVTSLICILGMVACSTDDNHEISLCLEIYKCIVMYSFVPNDALLQFISCICRVVNLIEVCQDAWNVMRNLMGTQLGHSALYNLCVIIQHSTANKDIALIRGAVFFIGMSLWGPNKVGSLKFSAMAILPILGQALESGHQLVILEVALQMESLVLRQDRQLTAPGWEEAITVIGTLVTKLNICDSVIKPKLQDHLKSTLFQLDSLAKKSQYVGSQTRLYDLVEMVSDLCPEQSVMNLIDYRSECLHPGRESWIERLTKLMERFYENETRQAVRLRILSVLKDTVLTNLLMYEDVLLEKAVLPFLSNIDSELDRHVKLRAVEVVSQLAVNSSGSRVTDLLDILEKLLEKFLHVASAQESAANCTRIDLMPCGEAVLGIIKVMKQKFHHPPVSTIKRCYGTLVSLLDQFYESSSKVIELTGEIRLEIFRCLLSLRARSDYHLGFLSPTEEGSVEVRFSPFVVCDNRAIEPGTPVDKEMVTLSLTRACKAVIKCLKEEKDWSVLHLVLSQIPSVLQNKGMLLRYGTAISLLAKALCSIIHTNSRMPELNLPSKFTRSDFCMTVYPVLAALGSYNRYLEADLQKNLIHSLQTGLLSRECSKVCIVALTACILEMSDSMYKLLPGVLINLSKISATVHTAIPVLEFLSTLISLPRVFASFNHEQYMSVFAITLPYTNPFKFNQYTVSLAHHVIIMWFLKCRLTSRKDFVKFVVKGLEGNVLQPFEEGNFRKAELAANNQDSSNRGRSLSWKEDKPPPRTRHMTGVTSRPQLSKQTVPDERHALHTFHQELTETSVDLMARYSFANPSVQPTRNPIGEFLMKSGQSASWLMGNCIFTVSVSGCSMSNQRSGLCDSCSQHCQPQDTESTKEATSEESFVKKRHASEQSTVVSSAKIPDMAPLSQDDLSLRKGKDTSSGEEVSGAAPRELCSCWCQGWCQIYVRRPSGDTSWLCRLQNGQLNSGFGDNYLADITSLLMADTGFYKDKRAKSRVLRSSSNPEITEQVSDLDLARVRQQGCQPIPEVDEVVKVGNQAKQLSSDKSSSLTGSRSGLLYMNRPRSNTIDTSSPVKSSRKMEPMPSLKEDRCNVISPQFLFLQLYQAMGQGGGSGEKPLIIPKAKQSSLKILDRIPSQETYKVGVLYVGPGQASNETAILGNTYGSRRYAAFLSGLGSLVDLSEVDPGVVFLGGIDFKDGDGEFAYIWQDDAMQVVYHTATLMPNRETDPQFNKKKRHIGNDYVAIVYNESGQNYEMGTVKGQFIYATVVVEPLDFESNKISILANAQLKDYIAHLANVKVVSDHNLSLLVRQIALHCNLAANIYSKLQSKADPYASNWLERLRHIKRLKGRLIKEMQPEDEDDLVYDFTRLCLNK